MKRPLVLLADDKAKGEVPSRRSRPGEPGGTGPVRRSRPRCIQWLSVRVCTTDKRARTSGRRDPQEGKLDFSKTDRCVEIHAQEAGAPIVSAIRSEAIEGLTGRAVTDGDTRKTRASARPGRSACVSDGSAWHRQSTQRRVEGIQPCCVRKRVCIQNKMII
jgi:hypothetical protein